MVHFHNSQTLYAYVNLSMFANTIFKGMQNSYQTFAYIVIMNTGEYFYSVPAFELVTHQRITKCVVCDVPYFLRKISECQMNLAPLLLCKIYTTGKS